jgi:rhodanese-related sulfurtransferase
MEQLLTFIANHPILVGAFAVVLAALIATESARMRRRWKELDTAEAILLINRRDPLILDVSNSTDYAKGHILNAEHMPPSRIESGNQRLVKSKSHPVLLYCKNGQVSPQMAKRLVQLGFEDVNVLRGGLAQWSADQQPVTRGKPGAKPAGKSRKGGKQERKRRNKDQGTKDQGTKDQGTKDQGTKDQGTKDQGTKDQGTKDGRGGRQRAADAGNDRADGDE